MTKAPRPRWVNALHVRVCNRCGVQVSGHGNGYLRYRVIGVDGKAGEWTRRRPQCAP